MADPQTITIDPRVALQEERSQRQAMEAYFANRVLILGQQLLELQQANAELTERLEQAAPTPEPAADSE